MSRFTLPGWHASCRFPQPPESDRLEARARSAAGQGFASVAIELPGADGRPALPGVEKARVDLMRAISAGERPDDDIIDRLILPLVERAVPEWQTALGAVLGLPEIGERVGFSGGVIAVAVRLAATDRRIAAAGLFAGSYVPRVTMDEARRITIPLHVLLQWDDEGNDRQMALDLFDAFASSEKTLYANMGGHTGVPSFAGRRRRALLRPPSLPDGWVMSTTDRGLQASASAWNPERGPPFARNVGG